MPVAGPFPPVGASPPMLGVPPAPVGPRMPDPRAIQDLKAGIAKLLDAAEKDPIVAKELNPLIQQAIRIRAKLLTPPKPSSDEDEDAELDQSPTGARPDLHSVAAALPQLMGMRQ